MDAKSGEVNMDDYSASSTTIKFEYPIPLPRGPIPASRYDNPSAGSNLLAFRSPCSWAAAYALCESRIVSQCKEGARIGCAVTASNKCKPPWWKHLTGAKPIDFKEREDCEVREMKACLAAADDKCLGFAKEKLLKPFRDARIAGKFRPRELRKLVCLASFPAERIAWLDLIGLDSVLADETTNYRASELLGSSKCYREYLK